MSSTMVSRREKLFEAPASRKTAKARSRQCTIAAVLAAVLFYFVFLHRAWHRMGPPAPEVDAIYVLRAAPEQGALARERYAQLASDLGGSTWVYLLVDDTKQAQKDGTRVADKRWSPSAQSHTLLVSERDCKRASALHTGMNATAHTAMALVGRFFEGVHFKHLWFLDAAARCHGSYAGCLAVGGAQHDLVAPGVGPYSDGVEWPWSELTGKISDVSFQNRWKSALPVARLSKYLLEQIAEDMKVSSGLGELYVPTFCAAINGTLLDMPKDKVGHFGPASAAGTTCSLPEAADNKWYYPC